MKGLLEQGRITHHRADASLHIKRDSILAYWAHDDQERQATLDEFTHDAQEQGYD